MTLLALAGCLLISDAEIDDKFAIKAGGGGGDTPGLEFTESQPDSTTVHLDENIEILLDSLVAEDLGELSGAGSTDKLEGTIEFSGAGNGWDNNDGDAFSFTLANDQSVQLTAAWDTAQDDLDFAIFGDGPPDLDGLNYVDWFSSFGPTNCRTNMEPEVCQTAKVLTSGITYYLVALGYQGSGEEPYRIELDWAE